MSSGTFKPPATSIQPQNTEDPSVKGKNYRLQETSANTPTSGTESKSYTFTGVTPGKAYLHPPDRLINGRVIYRVKFAGHMFVKDPRGSELAKDAIDKLLAAAAVKKANTGEDMQPVTLSVSIRSIICTERDGKKVLHQHPLHLISFSADDKRKKGNIFAYISRAKPPSQNHICYVFECSGTQAPELTATVGQAFELAYKEFLKTKKAQEDFKHLKQRLETCSPEEKQGILKQINAIEEARVKQAAKIKTEVVKKRAQDEKKIVAPNAPFEPTGTYVTSIHVQGPPSYNTSDADYIAALTSGKTASEDPKLAKQLADVQREVQDLEAASEIARHGKQMSKQPSVSSKWESIATAFEPFKMEPSMDPETQYLVHRPQTSDLDDVISKLADDISELEEAFSWRGRKGPADYEELEVPDRSPVNDELMQKIEGKLKDMQATTDDMDLPDLPANYVMREFQIARESASMPKKGTVKDAASSWHQKHHD